MTKDEINKLIGAITDIKWIRATTDEINSHLRELNGSIKAHDIRLAKIEYAQKTSVASIPMRKILSMCSVIGAVIGGAIYSMGKAFKWW